MLCPRCKRELEHSGELAVDQETYQVYQCDTCTNPIKFGASTFEAALTLAVNSAGQLFDPYTLERLDLN